MERKGLSNSRERNRKGKNGGEVRGMLVIQVRDLLIPGKWTVESYEKQGREERRKVYRINFGTITEELRRG